MANETNLMRKLRSERADLRAAIADLGFEFDENGCPIPRDPERRERLKHDFAEALRWYFPKTFYKEHTSGQISDISLMQNAIHNGGQFAFAAPRGDGKSSRAEGCTILALLHGFHDFVVIVGADNGLAKDMLDSIKLELRTNERLMDDFPEVCVAAFVCDDKAQRARALNYGGEDCRFRWGAELLILPNIPGSTSSGGVLVPRGITGRIRGIKQRHPDGRTLRPSLFVIDDFQTDESANSPSQCVTRAKLITKAILGAAGHGKAATALAPVTIINPNDAAAKILDREAHPEWHGRTRAMVVKWPDAQDTLWVEYGRIRKECQQNDEPTTRATQFYAENREAMDAGAVLDWVLDPDRDELSALQYAEDLLCDRGRDAFFSEYQNAPLSEIAGTGKHHPEFIKNRVNGLQPMYVPEDARWVTVGADVNKSGLHWSIVGTSQTLSCYVIAYGKYPQKGNLWDDDNDKEHKLEQIYKGIFAFCRVLQEYSLSGHKTNIDVVGVDCGHETHTVVSACQAADRVFPFKVRAMRGYPDEKYRPTGAIGMAMDKCHVSEFKTVKGSQVVVYSSGEWHKRVFDAWSMDTGAPGSLSLFEAPAGTTHDYIAEHVAADILVDVLEGTSGMVYRFDNFAQPNDLNDAITQAVVLGALHGASPNSEIARRELANQAAKARRGLLRQNCRL